MRSSVMPGRKQRGTMPETSFYYHLAYTVALGIYTAYALSLYIRRKRVRSGR
jgi:hypothetical protein